jgi:hypothetical protein
MLKIVRSDTLLAGGENTLRLVDGNMLGKVRDCGLWTYTTLPLQ